MRNRIRRPCCGTLLLVLGSWSAAQAAEARPESNLRFNRDVRPILSERCFACHGPDEAARPTDLRLDTADGAIADLGGYQAIVPGDPESSELIRRVTYDDPDERMPPPDWSAKLSADEVTRLRPWIEQGAQWEPHWSQVAPRRTLVPDVQNAAWPNGAIDRFVLAQLEDASLSPSPPADRRTLIRRITFDLLGLPPTPVEVETFLNDSHPGAYERLVERLLASPHYGERMAAYWLDLVRYADTNGIHGDNHRDHAPYRTYVIDAFNDNLPFDRFTTEQLAGDLLPEPSLWQRVASGYNRLNLTTREGGAQPGEYRAKYAADRVRNASAVWLATTLGCSECHDHKFDALTMRDFYSFAAFFADVQEEAIKAQVPELHVPSFEQTQRRERLRADIAALKSARTAETNGADTQLAALEAELEQLEAEIPRVLITVAADPRATRILSRGNWLDQSGDIVTPAVPAALGELPSDERRATRLDLARWLVDPDNPLVARVFVNRLWQMFFGHGLVRTPDDFGSQGAWPTHPDLLDWLAVEFVESGWDVKHMVRLIVMSAAYRQSSAPRAAAAAIDPGNQLLWRQRRFRLDAEFVRDQALTAAGLLAHRIGGPSVKPYQPAGYWAYLNFPKREYVQDSGEDLFRRGIYTYWSRTFLNPSLVAFDAPSREECAVSRARSNTPLQALVLLNDPIYVEAARALAVRIVREGGRSVDDRLQFGYRTVLGRPADTAELQTLAALVTEHQREFAADEQAARDSLEVGASPLAVPDGSTLAELAAYASGARVLLNLHETITRY